MDKYQVRQETTAKGNRYYVERQDQKTRRWYDCLGHAFKSLEAAIACRNGLRHKAELDEEGKETRQ